jgi:hypothetical protein
MQAIYAEATSYVGADPSVVELGSALRRLPAGAMRPNITRRGKSTKRSFPRSCAA